MIPDVDDRGLTLSLGFTSTAATPDNTATTGYEHKQAATDPRACEPSLSLSLAYHRQLSRKANDDPARSGSGSGSGSRSGSAFGSGSGDLSPVSSFSVKREREVVAAASGGVEEAEVERACSRASEEEREDEDGGNRKKLRLNKDQSALLEESFKIHSTLNPKQKQALAQQLNLRPRQVEVWFQNRRARTKLKQTEVDCDFWKKCCETLTDENRKLHKELQELRALKLAQPPFYMRLPAATLTICPSCERMAGGGGAKTAASSTTTTTPFAVASKPLHFYNPFTKPSAAC
ncbi:homeobox-leucine zipper protein [Dionaea muscipula]